MRRRLVLSWLTMLLLVPAALGGAPQTDFSGTWRQSNERCVPKRTGEVFLKIEQRGSELVVETNIVRSSGAPRHAVQRYRLDGTRSASTGADGDEFYTSIVWSGESLVFSIEEHEDGRVLLSKETWTLMEDGSTLKRERESLDAPAGKAPKQTLIYLRQPHEAAAR